MSNPNCSAARAPSLAYPLPQWSRARRHPTSTAGVNGASNVARSRPMKPMHGATPGTSTAHSPYPCSSNRASNRRDLGLALAARQVFGKCSSHLRVGVERRVRLEIGRGASAAAAADRCGASGARATNRTLASRQWTTLAIARRDRAGGAGSRQVRSPRSSSSTPRSRGSRSVNPALNAVIHERFDRARDEATHAPDGPFRGVPDRGEGSRRSARGRAVPPRQPSA